MMRGRVSCRESCRESYRESNSIPNLVKILEGESDIAISWLNKNNMISNPDKFHSLILSNDRTDNSGIDIKIGQKSIKSESYVKLLGVRIDNKLNFNSHISKLCKNASTQLNALLRLKNVLNFKAKLILVQSFIYANFNYCPLIWHFSAAKSLLKIECIQKRAIRFLYNDNESTYEELLTKANRNYMNIYRLKIICTEIYKTINDLNPRYMKNIFQRYDNE